MGVSIKTLTRLCGLHAQGCLPSGSLVVDIGAQELLCGEYPDAVRHVLSYFREHAGLPGSGCSDAALNALSDHGLLADFMELSGFRYVALDLFESKNTRLFDLNLHEAPRDLIGRADLVTNLGTTEHLINQYAAFRTIHRLTKVGGVMYHDVPMGGYLQHGYFCYTPLFFQHVALSNRYTVVGEHFGYDPVTRPLFEQLTRGGYGAPGLNDSSIESILQRTTGDDFKMPLESSTSLELSETLWGGPAPYGFIVNHPAGIAPASRFRRAISTGAAWGGRLLRWVGAR